MGKFSLRLVHKGIAYLEIGEHKFEHHAPADFHADKHAYEKDEHDESVLMGDPARP